MLALTPSAATQIVIGLSIFVPVIVAAALTIWVLRGAKKDPDEQRRRRLDAERRAAAKASERRE